MICYCVIEYEGMMGKNMKISNIKGELIDKTLGGILLVGY